jgi:glutamate racemase
MKGSIGVFDSGYGGLTVLKSINETLPDYDCIYLADNARNPYGTRSFDVIYSYTLEAVNKLFDMGCQLVILACNTASAKALKTIQCEDLPLIDSTRRVLGVIRPSAEILGELTESKHIGILATSGTVNSLSYIMEIEKLYGNTISVQQHDCPMWVPLVENNEIETKGADYFIEKDVKILLDKDPFIDTILLACTHYPLLADKIKNFIPASVRLVNQGDIVAASLKDYLLRHPEMDERCTKGGSISFFTTETPDSFSKKASVFMEKDIKASHISL